MDGSPVSVLVTLIVAIALLGAAVVRGVRFVVNKYARRKV